MLIPVLWAVAIISAALSFLIWALLVRPPTGPSVGGEDPTADEGGDIDEDAGQTETETRDIAEERDDRDTAT